MLAALAQATRRIRLGCQVTGMVYRVAVVSPDATSRAAIGRNVLNPAARAPSAEAGRAALV